MNRILFIFSKFEISDEIINRYKAIASLLDANKIIHILIEPLTDIKEANKSLDKHKKLFKKHEIELGHAFLYDKKETSSLEDRIHNYLNPFNTEFIVGTIVINDNHNCFTKYIKDCFTSPCFSLLTSHDNIESNSNIYYYCSNQCEDIAIIECLNKCIDDIQNNLHIIKKK